MSKKNPSEVLDYFYSSLQEMEKVQASDLYFTVGRSPSMRIKDEISLAKGRVVDEETLSVVLDRLLTPKQKKEFQQELELNFSIILKNGSRFRANLFQQQEKPGLVIRRINVVMPTIEELGLPSIYGEMVMKKHGLIVLASPSGSGKSTSMAAMLEHRNRFAGGHVLTIEDPIEFSYTDNKCIFTQREVGIDTHSFENALDNALRQKADVIVVGEVRSREAMVQVLRFVEAGHLCVTTLHANSAVQAVKRMVSFFPDDMKEHIYLTLSQNLLSIFSQKLVHSKDGGRAIAIEVLRNEGLVRNHIEDGKIGDILDVMERVSNSGMCTMDQALFELYKAGKVAMEVIMHEAQNPSNLRLHVIKELGGIMPSTTSSGDF